MEPAHENVQQSYPLSALFLLLAACGVVCALLTPVIRAVMEGQVGGKDTAMASLGGALLSMCGGAIIGLYHYRPFRGLGWGILSGGVIGLIVGPIILAPPESLASLMAMAVGGAVVLIVTGLFFGTVMRGPENEDAEPKTK
jgi:hypothetical protein